MSAWAWLWLCARLPKSLEDAVAHFGGRLTCNGWQLGPLIPTDINPRSRDHQEQFKTAVAFLALCGDPTAPASVSSYSAKHGAENYGRLLYAEGDHTHARYVFNGIMIAAAWAMRCLPEPAGPAGTGGRSAYLRIVEDTYLTLRDDHDDRLAALGVQF